MTQLILPEDNLYKRQAFSYFSSNAVISFEAICRELQEKFECIYTSYALEITNTKRVHYYSNKIWQRAFIEEKLIVDCPIVAFGIQEKANILEWNSLASILNRRQKRVMQARASHNIGNGVGLRQKFYGLTEFTMLGGERNNYQFGNMLLTKLTIIKPLILSLRTIALAHMVTQGWLSADIVKNNLIFINSGNKMIH